MIKTLYLMSDPETLFDLTFKLQGWSDMPLTDDGTYQAERVGRYFLSRLDRRPDTLVASTSERASDALEISWRAAYGETPLYERSRDLKGLNYGSYEGQDLFLAPDLPFEDFFVRFGGESEEDVKNRLRRELTEILLRPSTTVAFVASHADACALFRTLWDGAQDEALFVPADGSLARILGDGYRNCQVFAYTFDTDTQMFSFQGIVWNGYSGTLAKD